eukprot:scaffold14456_cov92-Amphora_coffeaeformis.AAC.1
MEVHTTRQQNTTMNRWRVIASKSFCRRETCPISVSPPPFLFGFDAEMFNRALEKYVSINHSISQVTLEKIPTPKKTQTRISSFSPITECSNATLFKVVVQY